jgi:hypothetical protein
MDSDLKGSATVLVSMALHFGHSKVRLSDPPGSGETRASIIGLWHRSQRGRSIGESARSAGILAIYDSPARMIALPYRSLFRSAAEHPVISSLQHAILRTEKVNICAEHKSV